MVKTPSVEPVLQSRMLPRISFRWLFALMTLAALIAAVARAAGEGGTVAYALLTSLLFLASCFAVFVLLFVLARAVAGMWYQPSSEIHDGSPFADGQLPPQILPPRDPGA
jgi:hypothetical protein